MGEGGVDINKGSEIIDAKPAAPVGWSLRKEVYESLETYQITIESLMREEEIREIEKHLEEGKKVIVYGNDGYGKTTLLREMAHYKKGQGYEVVFINVIDFRDSNSLIKLIELINSCKNNPERQPIIMIDSGDYLWEQTDDSKLITQRTIFLTVLLESKLPVVMTLHKDEPRGKKTDDQTRQYFTTLLKKSGLIEIELSPVYKKQKVKAFFEGLGFIPQVAEMMAKDFYARNHALLANYFIKECQEKNFPDNLNNLFTKREEEMVNNFIKNIFKSLNKQRTLDFFSNSH